MLATGGDTHLGGDDFDERIVEYAVAEFKKSDRIDLTRDPAAMGRLKEEAEKAKKSFPAPRRPSSTCRSSRWARTGPIIWTSLSPGLSLR